jgi:Glycoside hydrolase family 44
MRFVSFFALSLMAVAAHAVAPLVVYDDALQSGFTNGTWANGADYSLVNTSPTYGGSGDSIRFVARGWGGLQFVASPEFNLVDYQSLTFQVHGGSAGGQKLQMYVCDNYNNLTVPNVFPLESLIPGGAGIPANAWATATLDFNSAGLTFGTFNCIVIMDADGNNDAVNGQPAAYIDQIVFNPRTSAPPSGGTVNVSVNASANVHALNPLIFGVAYGNSTRNAQMGYTVDRWGGNGATRYNWQVDVHSTASDYFWENIPDCTAPSCIGTPPAGNSADAFITAALSGGVQPLMTIPTIGWTPRADSPHSHPYLAGFAVSKYGAQVPMPFQSDAVDPFDTNAGSGECNPSSNSSPNCVLYDATNGRYHIINNDPHDTSTVVDQNFGKSWVAHMQSAHGTAANGGVKLFTLDNEVMLWNSTHRDLHPNGPTYNEIWGKAQSYGAAIKQQEPDALVTGPVTWGYCDLFTSADDAARGNCFDGTDRSTNHGGLPFIAWYLQQVCANPLAGGKHLVDYIDLHYYPQGQNVALNNDDSAATAARRLKSVKELYDSTWVSDSWIGGQGDNDANHYSKPNLIPRVKAWINQYCPGTKLAITEYNWGNDNTGSGAVAQAEVLAVFAREGVDMATRWIAPDANTKAERGFSIFLNYDGAGAKVSGDSVAATSANVDQIGAYAFHGNQRTMVLLTNKDTVTHDVALTFDSTHSGTWKLYGFTGTSALAQIGTNSINGSTLTLSALPPISASLLVIPDVDEIFKDGFGG